MSNQIPREDDLAALPEHLQEALRGEFSDSAAGETIPPVDRAGPMRLSWAQQRLWFSYELDPDGVEYNVATILRLRGELDVEALRRALHGVVERHESLRTTFDSVDGQGVQRVQPVRPLPVPLIDLAGKALAGREAEVDRWVMDSARRPFDLRSGPVFRANILRLDEREHLLVLSTHHIATDGWSMGVFMNDLAALYSAARDGRPAGLAPLNVQHADFAAWQRTSTTCDEQVDYWRRQLDGLPRLELVPDRPRPPVRTAAGSVHEFEIPPAVVAGLKRLSQANGATLFMTLVAATKLLLARYTGQRDIAVATATSGRGRIEVENVIGLFVNTLVLRTDVDESRPFAHLLASTRATVLDAFANEDAPFQRLVEVLGPDRDPSRPPLVDVAVNLYNLPARTPTLRDIEVDVAAPPVVVASMDLSFDFGERDGALAGFLGYNTDLFDPVTIERMAGHLATLLEAIAADPGRTMVELPMTTAAEVLTAPTGPAVSDTAYVAPRTPVEQILAEVWAELLGVERVGVTDNFFELGGDSILSLQVVARARAVGIELTPKQAILRPTIADLAAVAGVAGRMTANPGPVVGPVPLTPAQHWFFENLTGSLDRFNQAMFLELPEDVDDGALAAAVAALPDHHDALRLRYEHVDGQWRQRNAAPDAADLLRVVDLANLDRQRQDAELDSAVTAAQAGFSLANGPLLRALLFVLGDGRRPRLFLAAHHLVVDAVSWRILLSDLDAAYRLALRGDDIVLAPKTTSVREWADRLAASASEGEFDRELDHWRSAERAASAARLPLDRPVEAGANTVASAATVSVRLSAEHTHALLHLVPQAYRTQVNDVLLSALGRVVSGWAGRDTVSVDLEGHGREEIFDGVDLSRTVGWLATKFPLALTVPTADWGSVLKSVKEQLRAVPRHGIGYGALRYLGRDGHGLGGGRPPEIAFNYLGRFDPTATGEGVLGQSWCEYRSVERSPGQNRQHLLEIDGIVLDGQLEFRWTYSAAAHDEDTVARLANDHLAALVQIIGHCVRPDAGGSTPSDFPLVKLDQATVDRIVGPGRRVADIYPLTPMQSGMLFHSLAEPDHDVYLGHYGVVVDGVADAGALVDAWRRVVDRTPALRTSISWEHVDEPVQLVWRAAELPVTCHDWRALPETAQRDALARLWERRGEHGLDLTRAPLLRLTLVRLSDTRVQLFWSAHRILFDGRSLAQVLSDVFEQYAILAGNADVTPAVRRPYRDYVEWLGRQDHARAQDHWRQVVSGFSAPTRLPYDRAPLRAHRSRSSREVRLRVDRARSERLYEFARSARLTVDTLILGAWAALLSRYSGERDVCFGATVSGRPAELTGSDSIIGRFATMLPVRVEAPGDRTVISWLEDLQNAQLEARQYDHVSLTRIRSLSAVPPGTSMFDSTVVFENRPYDPEAAARHGLRIGGFAGDEHTNYALTLTAHADDELLLKLGYDPALFDAETIERMAGHLATLLDAIAGNPDGRLADLEMLPDAERHELLTQRNATSVAFPPARCVHELFAEQVRRTPDAVAVVSGSEQLTFAQLDERANRLANHLVGLGVRPGTLVAVCLDRGVGAIAALLGVLKAGRWRPTTWPTWSTPRARRAGPRA